MTVCQHLRGSKECLDCVEMQALVRLDEVTHRQVPMNTDGAYEWLKEMQRVHGEIDAVRKRKTP